MSDRPTPPPAPPEPPEEHDERLGRLADRLADGVRDPGPVEGLDADDLARMAHAARALEDAVALGPSEIAALLADEGAAAAPMPLPDLPEDYEVLGELGRGGMGVVYRARQRSLDRVVAVKVLRPGELLFGQSLQRFQQEARVLARLRHPHIVGVHEVGERNGRVYFTMELIEGRALSVVLREGLLTPARAVKLLKQVAAAVAYVHAHGLVHRDLKPANILVDEHDHVTVTDFGLAFEVGSDDGLTLTGQVVGTPGYMSPEQARGDLAAVGEATDVHALGVLLYEMLAGRRPFQDLSPAEQVYAVIHQDPPRPRRVNPAAPEALERVALQAMRKRPAERYASARAFLEDLERFEEGLVVRAKARGLVYRAGRFLRRRARALAGAVLALGLLTAVTLVWVAPRLTTRRAALEEAAFHLLADGDGEGATRLFERARRDYGEGSEPAEIRTDLRLTQARVQWVESLWRQGRDEQAAQVLDAAEREMQARYPNRRMPGRQPLLWALGMRLALEGKESAARTYFQDAAGGSEESRDRSLLRNDDGTLSPGSLERQVFSRWWDAIRGPEPRARRVGLLQLRALWRHRWPLSSVVLREDSDGAYESAGPWPLPSLAEVLPYLLEALLLPDDWPSKAFAFYGLRDASVAWQEPGIDAALEALALDEARPVGVRRLAALLVAERGDLPFAVTGLQEGEPDFEFDLVEVVREARRVRALPLLEAFAARLDLGFRELARATSLPEADLPRQAARGSILNHLSVRLRERSGVPESAPGGLEAWWVRHSTEDPRDRLAARIGWKGRAEAKDVPALLARMATASPADRAALHQLLTLIVDPSVPRPVGRSHAAPTDFLAHWQAQLGGLQGPHRLRLARVLLTPPGPVLDPRADRLEPVPNQGRFTLHHELGDDGEDLGARFAFAVWPASSNGPAHRTTLDVGLQVGSDVAGPLLRVLSVVEKRPGSNSSSSGGGKGVQVGYVMGLNLDPGSWSSPDPDRLEVLLAVVEPASAPPTPLDLEAWTARLALDVKRLADGAADAERREAEEHRGDPVAWMWTGYNHYLGDRQDTLMRLAMLGTRIPLPEARGDLQRLFDLSRRGLSAGWHTQLLLRARLLAGDETLLDDPAFGPFLGGAAGWPPSGSPFAPNDREGPRMESGEDELAATSSGKDGEFWARLLAWTPSERLRALAVEHLERGPVSDRAAGDLLAAERAGRVRLTPSLAERLARGPTEDRSFWGQVRGAWAAFAAVALLHVGILWTAARLVLGSRSRWKRLSPAGGLIVLGGLMACVTAVAAGRDLLPDDLGLGLMALGAAVLARETRLRSRWVAPALLASSGLLALAERWTVLPPGLALLRGHLAAVGVLLLPWLGAALVGYRPRAAEGRPATARARLTWRALAWCALLSALAILVVGLLTSPAPWGRETLKLVLVAAVAGPLAAACAWSLGTLLERLGRADARRMLGWPWMFVLLYVLPTAVSLGAYIYWLLCAGVWSLRLEGGGWTLLLVACGVCLLWALLQPLRGARVRAAYLMLAASRRSEGP